MNNKFNVEEWKEQDKQLEILVKTLNSKTSWIELENLEKIHKGIIVKYWRTFYKQFTKFTDFLDNIEDRFPEQYWPDEDEAVSEGIEIADRLTKPFTLDIDAIIAKIIKDNP